MPEVRVIKKYPNRRLYDTEKSRYITLSDVRTLVLDEVDFVVVDKKSGEDLTRGILLQVISEQEQQGEAIMSQAFLAHVIRAYGKLLPIAGYLEQCLGVFANQQQAARGHLARGGDAVTPVADIARLNYARWTALQDEGPPRDVADPSDVADRPLREDRKKAG